MMRALIIGLLLRLTPGRWRESVAGDLEEEHGATGTTAWHAARLVARLWIEEVSIARRRPRRRFTMQPTGLQIRQAVRALLKRPAYSLIVVATLAIGIGANAAVFSLANWLMFRPVPGVHEPDRLVTIYHVSQGGGVYFLSQPEIDAVREQVPALSAAAGAADDSFNVAIGAAAPERVPGELVSANYFEVLGMRPRLGRFFAPGETGIVISHAFWQTRFGGAADVAGKTVLINGEPQPVLGVAPKGFAGASRSADASVWAPTTRTGELAKMDAGLYLMMIGRLAGGASTAAVQPALALAPGAVARMHPRPSRYESSRYVASTGLAAPVFERDRLGKTFALLMAMVALLLVLTCANVGNVMLARGAARRAELATRRALGASRRQIAGAVLIESVLLALTGGLVAIVLAAWVSSLMRGTVVLSYLPALGDITLDRRVLGFALAMATLTAIGAGLLPAVAATRFDLLSTLKGTSRSVAATGSRLRRLLIAAQVAISVTLLIGALLLARSVHERRHVDPGFDPASLMTFSVSPGTNGAGRAERQTFYTRLMAQLSETAGVSSAALGWSRPFGRIANGARFRAAGSAAREMISAEQFTVGPRYFETMGIRLIDGREFVESDLPDDDDANIGKVIVSESVARRLFGSSRAIGRMLEMSYPEGARREIVGVAAGVRLRRAFEPAPEALYSPFGRGSSWATVHVRSSMPMPALAPALREAVRQVDPALPLFDLMSVREAIELQMSEEVLVGRLALAFAVLAALLAAVGLYGVLAQAVAERRVELGIRAALGAAPGRVLRAVASDALRLTLMGAAAGIALSLWLTRYLESRLFGVERFDPLMFGAALALMLLTSLVAAAIPALRASRVDPVVALRQ